MEKRGDVRVGSTPCDECSRKAAVVRGKKACCRQHDDDDEGRKQASHGGNGSLKAFTAPLA
jgi:hypothetical protein